MFQLDIVFWELCWRHLCTKTWLHKIKKKLLGNKKFIWKLCLYNSIHAAWGLFWTKIRETFFKFYEVLKYTYICSHTFSYYLPRNAKLKFISKSFYTFCITPYCSERCTFEVNMCVGLIRMRLCQELNNSHEAAY